MSRRGLIVAPERVIADLIGDVVELAGATPLVAYDGREALSLARSQRPALVITTLLLPYLCGEDLITALHQEWGATLPVILLSGAPHAQRVRAGADAMLTKPFRLADLLALMSRYLVSVSIDHRKEITDQPLRESFEKVEWTIPSAEPLQVLPVNTAS